MRRVHVLVRGKVQGVGYRYTAAASAERFGVTGWVRNLADGTVEAEVEGRAGDVDRMLEWMGQGPPGARVEAVETADAAPVGLIGFQIRHGDGRPR